MSIGTPNVGTYTERPAELSTNVPFPMVVNAGDTIYLLGVIGSTSNTAITTPAGFTQLDQHITAGGVGPDVAVFRKTGAAGTEGGTTLAVSHVSQPSNWQILTFSGVDQTTPEDVAVVSQATNSASLTQTIPGLTPVTSGVTLLYVAALNSTTGNATPATGFTETGDRVSGTRAMEVAYQQGVGTGPTGNLTITWTVSAKSVGVLIAIRPVVGAAYTGTASPVVTVGTSSAGHLGRSGVATPTVTISAASAAHLGLHGTATPAVSVAAASAGVRGKVATATAALAIAAVSAGVVVAGLSGNASPTVTITTSSAAALGIHGQATPALAVAATSTLARGRTGTASPAIAFSVAAAGTVAHGLSGTSTPTLTISVDADGEVNSGNVGAATPTLTITVDADGVLVKGPTHTQVSWDTGRTRDGVAVATWEPAVVDPPMVLPVKTRAIKVTAIDSVSIDGTHATPTARTVGTTRTRHRVVVGGKDVTYFRGVETPEPTYGLVSPLLWGSGSIIFPQIHAAFERPGHGELWWLKPKAPVKVQRVNAAGDIVDVTYRGFISDFDLSGRTMTCTLGGQATGRASLQDREPPIFPAVTDIADQALNTIRHRLRLSTADAVPSTGIEIAGTGGGKELDFLTTLMAQSTTLDGRQWTIMPNDDGRYRMFRKDTTTLDFTVYLDDKQAVGNLRRDFAEEPNRVYATAVTPAGMRLRFGIYPGLTTGSRPAFPGSMSEGDTGDGVIALIWRLFTMGYIDGGADGRPNLVWGPGITKAVKQLQDDADLDQTGVVNLDTWQALFDHDVTGWSLRRAHVVPAAQRSYTRAFRRSASGQILGRNPRYDRSKILVDRTVDMGSGFTRGQVRDWSAGQLDNDLPNWVGTIDLPMGAVIDGEHNPGDPLSFTDVRDARTIKPGMNAWLPTFDGGTLIHVSGCELNADGSVQLTVDSRARDTMAVWEVITRNRESRRHPARQWIAQNRSSRMTRDSMTGWDEIGGLVDDRVTCPAHTWTVFDVVAGTEGQIRDFDIQTSNAPAEFVVAVFGAGISPAALHALVPFPLTDDGRRNWRRKHHELTVNHWLLYAAGVIDNPAGYHPTTKPNAAADFPDKTPAEVITGRFKDEAGFPYFCSDEPVVRVAIYPDRACQINPGRLFKAQQDDQV